MVNQKNITELLEIESLLKQASNFVLVKFERTPHVKFEELRKQLKKDEAKLRVVKNTLLSKVLNKIGKGNKDMDPLMTQIKEVRDNSALLTLGKDWSKALNSFYKFSQQEKTLSFKIGYIDNQTFSSADMERLAQLPSKEELIAKIIGSMKSPISHLTHAMKFNTQKIVYILSEQSKKTN